MNRFSVLAVRYRRQIAVAAFMLLISACQPGGSGGDGTNTSVPFAGPQSLSVAEVNQILQQAINEALARGVRGTIAVTDRLGNVLAVFRMTGAATNIQITSGRAPPVASGLEGVLVPDTLAAIAKAVTGAFLSSRGHAFTTRTASQIIQEHFNPGELLAPSGPLFGVQFSQLPCSDLNIRFISASPQAFIGPKRSPLGLAGDSGGLPLYKSGDLVGGIGVISDGIYGIDLSISNIDSDNDEFIALAGQSGFEPPAAILATQVTVEGKTLRYSDATAAGLFSNPAAAGAFVDGVDGLLTAVTGYFDGLVVPGRVFGAANSGIRADASGDFAGFDAFVLVDGGNAPRFPPVDSSNVGTGGLTRAEVISILRNALDVAFRARSQIRRPLGASAEVTIAVVDSNSRVLGVVRTPDAPVFGTDVSLQKARTAALFSNTVAAADFTAAGVNLLGKNIGDYVADARIFLGDATALSNGIAFSDRAGGNLSRPFYADGINGNPNGPFSRPFNDWSPFSTGLQLDLVVDNLVQHLQFVTGAAGVDTAVGCTSLPVVAASARNRAANGTQIFPGSVPIYRGNTLVGGIGVSGDGVDQDDLISFLGLHQAGLALGTGIGNAPPAIRADNLAPNGVNLRYVSCPFAPFLNSGAQNVCNGL